MAPDLIRVFAFTSEPTAVEELKRGTIDWLEASPTALPLLQAAAKDGPLRVTVFPASDIRLVGIKQIEGKSKERAALGRALNLATDRRRITDLFGGGEAVGGPVPPSVAADLPQYKFDLTAASAIVKEYSLGSETHRCC